MRSPHPPPLHKVRVTLLYTRCVCFVSVIEYLYSTDLTKPNFFSSFYVCFKKNKKNHFNLRCFSIFLALRKRSQPNHYRLIDRLTLSLYLSPWKALQPSLKSNRLHPLSSFHYLHKKRMGAKSSLAVVEFAASTRQALLQELETWQACLGSYLLRTNYL